MSDTLSRRDTTKRKILSFAELPIGWHYGSGVAATHEAIAAALEIPSLLADAGADAIEAFPDVDGGVLVSGYHDKQTLDVLCDKVGAMTMVYERDDNTMEDPHSVSLDQLREYLGDLGWKLEKSSVCFTIDITATTAVASRVPRSKNRLVKGEAFRLWTSSAPLSLPDPNANTSRSFIKALLETPPFSGVSAPISFHRGAPLPVNAPILTTLAIATSEDYRTASAGEWFGT